MVKLEEFRRCHRKEDDSFFIDIVSIVFANGEYADRYKELMFNRVVRTNNGYYIPIEYREKEIIE